MNDKYLTHPYPNYPKYEENIKSLVYDSTMKRNIVSVRVSLSYDLLRLIYRFLDLLTYLN